ncbi:Pituitary tumor-transforming gene 1 protein-interacting protein [Collichthys lucidus]|uniref:Pituitary tumor-transforming gene 1 protein-interacting protein n=1 Tax=Collichthys lucidus TaxID=240159 RepID=A0A4U5V354_COLLU|nr:Pituitary tumor-transforming gene 1 protein-interacting protein [Collichthys lucidus]
MMITPSFYTLSEPESLSHCLERTATFRCLWCFTTNNCTEYPVSWLLPPASVCQLSQARWGVCWLNFEALIIAMAVLGGTILIAIAVCCCCCCCCKKRRAGPDRDEERFARKREEIKQRAEERPMVGCYDYCCVAILWFK